MNKKQIVVTGLLLSLMLLLAITQGFFVDNFSRVNVTESSEEYKECAFEGYSVTFPSEWIIDEEEKKDEYISYNIEFKSRDNTITGLVQVINTKQEVRDYAEKDIRKQSLEYSNNEIIPFENSDSIGVLSRYNTDVTDGYSYVNKSYYIKGRSGQIIKVLFNISKDRYNQALDKDCSEIITSIKQNK